jgi:geranylgeranyl diphosphate synthase type I
MGSFEQQLTDYKQKIDSVRAYCELLGRGGKRIRGILTITGYHMFGGTDDAVALEAAKALEMLQAYILMVDDIQDKSVVRRGGPSAHILLKNIHEQQNLKGDSQHFGESVAMNGFLFGAHSAIDVIADLDVDAEQRLRAIRNVNKYFIATAHGQTLDIFNEATATTDEDLVNNVLIWKTAFYSILNPLQLGAILAGANESDLRGLEAFALAAGRTFQITDDIIGVFGDDDATGKSAMDDIKEGKRTILSVRALKSTNPDDAAFLEHMLGNEQLTVEQFDRCKSIIEQSGALDYAKNEAGKSAEQAIVELDRLRNTNNNDQIAFLAQLTESLLHRVS